MATTILIDPALPLGHRANTDAEGHWPARLAALNALCERLIAEGASYKAAADYAIANLDTELEAQAKAAQKLAQARQRAADKALFHRAGGVEPRRVGNAWLVPSATTAGTVYRVQDGRCNCQAGESGKPCWHAALVEAVAAEQPTPQPPAPVAIDPKRVAQMIATARAERAQAA